MIDELYVLEIESRRDRHRTRPRSPWERRMELEAEGFQCAHCRVYVSSNPRLAGVANRNHCPYCLWSRHLDLFAAGDRLAACRQAMRPVGLTLKHNLKKYGNPGQGELMLVHECLECGKVSINRIATDDLAENLLEVFEGSIAAGIPERLSGPGLHVMGRAEQALVVERLFGRA
jgi:hypothetical protein